MVWDKQISEDFSLAMAELAWTSFDKLQKILKCQRLKTGKYTNTKADTAL